MRPCPRLLGVLSGALMFLPFHAAQGSGWEVSLSASDTEAYVNWDAPTAVDSVWLWVTCAEGNGTEGQGARAFNGRLVITGSGSVTGFTPTDPLATNLCSGSDVCMAFSEVCEPYSFPLLIGRFNVNGVSGGAHFSLDRIPTAPDSGLYLVSCQSAAVRNFEIRGLSTDGNCPPLQNVHAGYGCDPSDGTQFDYGWSDGYGTPPIGHGISGQVHSLHTLASGDVVAAGRFGQAGGAPVNNIALWDGTGWSSLGSGLGVGGAQFDQVRAVTESAGGIVGQFDSASGTPARSIARWDGSWHAVGSPIDGVGPDSPVISTIRAMTVWNGQLIVGGNFTEAGGGSTDWMASWDGTRWSPFFCNSGAVGQLVALTVYSTATLPGDLVAFGGFGRMGTLTNAGHIARWDGRQWRPFGQGFAATPTSSSIGALTVSGPRLFVGGTFGPTAGPKGSHGIAVWNDDGGDEVGVPPGGALAGFDLHLRAEPNPSADRFEVSFSLPQRSSVRLGAYDVTGRRLEMLVEDAVGAGQHALEWSVESRAPGVYFLRLQAGERTATTKVVVTR